MRSAIGAHDGYVFPTAGDAFAAAFARASDAVELQRRLAVESWPEDVEIELREGPHDGEAHERDGDYWACQ